MVALFITATEGIIYIFSLSSLLSVCYFSYQYSLALTYGVCVSQLVRYVCVNHKEFVGRWKLLTIIVVIVSRLKKFQGSNRDLLALYSVAFSKLASELMASAKVQQS